MARAREKSLNRLEVVMQRVVARNGDNYQNWMKERGFGSDTEVSEEIASLLVEEEKKTPRRS
jgi:hypothetical protein